MNYNNIVNASTGYTREERVMGYHYEYKARLIKGYALEDFANDINNLKNKIQDIEQTKEHLKKTSHEDVCGGCGGELPLELRKKHERKENWSEHSRKKLELSIASEYYFRKKCEHEEANKPWWKFW